MTKPNPPLDDFDIIAVSNMANPKGLGVRCTIDNYEYNLYIHTPWGAKSNGKIINSSAPDDKRRVFTRSDYYLILEDIALSHL